MENDETLISFTDNFEDDSTEAGFQFTFYCDKCHEGYKTSFRKSKTTNRGGLLRTVGDAAGVLGRMTGRHNIGYSLDRGTDVLGDRFSGMSAAWQKEHQKAFERAQNETKGRFNRCPKCTKWVCDNCWNETVDLCVDCAPREGVEVASARAEKMVEDIHEKADETRVFTGEVDRGQTLCPKCGKPAGEGSFCSNCGESLEFVECPECGAGSDPDANFCDDCGTRLR
ncbi:MAG: hypothetical protein ACI91T_000429 [Natronomonas sp.]|jgi:hypothetical protein